MKPVVMVIDDDYGIANLLSLMLAEHGYGSITASNGRVALNTLAHCTLPSLIVTDYVMPVMNGCEFAETIFLQEDLQHIPVLIMTGSDINELRLPTTSNFKGIIAKPFTINKMIETIQSHLELPVSYPLFSPYSKKSSFLSYPSSFYHCLN